MTTWRPSGSASDCQRTGFANADSPPCSPAALVCSACKMRLQHGAATTEQDAACATKGIHKQHTEGRA